MQIANYIFFLQTILFPILLLFYRCFRMRHILHLNWTKQ